MQLWIEENLGKVKNKTGFIKSYSNLLRTIRKTNNPVQVSSAFPNSEKTSVVELTSDTIVKKVDQIDEFFTETIRSKVYKGFLVALDMRSRRFKLEEDNGNVIQGTINDTLLVESFNIPDRYIAEIKTTEFVDRKDLSIKKVNRLITLSHNEN